MTAQNTEAPGGPQRPWWESNVSPPAGNWWEGLSPSPPSGQPSPEAVERLAVRRAETLLLRTMIMSGDPVPPEYYEALGRRGVGWKLHLNFDPYNPEVKDRVGTELDELKASGAVHAFKIGKRGGIEAGQPGKEATVYVGAKDDAVVAARQIETRLQAVLLPSDPEVMSDDIPFTPNVAGRFDAHALDDRFHQYGAPGHPILDRDMDDAIWSRNVSGTPDAAAHAAAIERAEALLRHTYGSFYTGTETQSGSPADLHSAGPGA